MLHKFFSSLTTTSPPKPLTVRVTKAEFNFCQNIFTRLRDRNWTKTLPQAVLDVRDELFPPDHKEPYTDQVLKLKLYNLARRLYAIYRNSTDPELLSFKPDAYTLDTDNTHFKDVLELVCTNRGLNKNQWMDLPLELIAATLFHDLPRWFGDKVKAPYLHIGIPKHLNPGRMQSLDETVRKKYMHPFNSGSLFLFLTANAHMPKARLDLTVSVIMRHDCGELGLQPIDYQVEGSPETTSLIAPVDPFSTTAQYTQELANADAETFFVGDKLEKFVQAQTARGTSPAKILKRVNSNLEKLRLDDEKEARYRDQAQDLISGQANPPAKDASIRCITESPIVVNFSLA